MKYTDLEPEGYLFEIGQKVKFTGLLENPECNGQVVTIRDYRPCSRSEYCPSGRAYYLEEPLPGGGDWIYQERLTVITGDGA